jgi:hypothetical protein
MEVTGDRTQGFTCDVDNGRVVLRMHERTRADEPRAAFRWAATIVCEPSGRVTTGDGEAPFVTFWTAANAYRGATDEAGFPSIDWEEVAVALEAAGVTFGSR